MNFDNFDEKAFSDGTKAHEHSALNFTRAALKNKIAAYAIFFCFLYYAGDVLIYPRKEHICRVSAEK